MCCSKEMPMANRLLGLFFMEGNLDQRMWQWKTVMLECLDGCDGFLQWVSAVKFRVVDIFHLHIIFFLVSELGRWRSRA